MKNLCVYTATESFNERPAMRKVVGFLLEPKGATQEARFSSYCRLLPPRQIAKLLEENKITGAGDGNRTHVPSLGSVGRGSVVLPGRIAFAPSSSTSGYLPDELPVASRRALILRDVAPFCASGARLVPRKFGTPEARFGPQTKGISNGSSV